MTILDYAPVADLESVEHPHWGGRLFFRGDGTAGCQDCGWSGVPTILDGERSTFCPGCEVPDPSPLWEPARKVGRNDPCPCESGRKFKKCCGAA